MVTLRTASATALIALFSAGCAGNTQVAPAGSDLQVSLVDGTTASWSSLVAAQGRTVVVFATLWCEICRRERPAVEAWARDHRSDQRTIYVFSGGELPDATQQIKKLGLDPSAFTVVVDADGRLADHYGVESTPTLLVLGAQGRVLSTAHRFEQLDLH
jgi:thiol-disulfide isomerase/thioredoxin